MNVLTTDQIQITRRVVVGSDRSVVVTPVVGGPQFEVELIPPRLRRELDSSPRRGSLWKVRYVRSPVSFYDEPLEPGDRFMARGYEWEVVSRGQDTLAGLYVPYQEARALPLSVLYPYVCSFQEMDGTVVSANVLAAIFRPREEHQPIGTYENYGAECPVEVNGLRPNRQLVVGGLTYKIVTATFNQVEPYTELQLRRAGIS